MATGPEDTFNKALRRFQDSLTEPQQRQFSTTSLEDVESEIQKIQRRYGAEKRLRNLKKISKFIEAMKQVEQVVKVFLNVHEVVAFVWGPIKFALVVAATRIDALELLLNTYVEVGEVIPGLRQYDQIFKNWPTVREVLERYLHDILQFHRKALDVFDRPAWETILRSAWKTFETSFKPILDSLKRHRTLLSDEKLTAAIAEIQDVRQLTVTGFYEQSARSNTRFDELSHQLHNRFEELSKQLYESQGRSTEKKAREQLEVLRQRISFIAEKLEPPDYDADQDRTFDQRFPTSGDWILSDPHFVKWLDPQNASYSTLYLHGIPGAGKTTLVSRVIDHLRSQTTASMTPLLFFYFKHHDATKQSMRGMLRALLIQLLYQDDSLIEYLYEKCYSTSPPQLKSLSMLKELARECLRSQHRCLIVLDGLDECGHEQTTTQEGPKDIIEWFQNAVVPCSRPERGGIRLLLSGQRDGFLDQHLSACPCIKLDATNAHLRNIRGYAESRASDIQTRFSLGDSDQNDIIIKVTAASKGMFLYAKVVLDNLIAQGSEAELEHELKTENFPDGLQSAYERVVVRVLERPARSQRETAIKILGWVTCAARPLRWREIQSRFCIDSDQGSCNFKNRRVDHCKVLCGSLIETEQCDEETQSSETTQSSNEIAVSLVHDTAGKYLVHTGRIHPFEEHSKMALFCSRYLTSGPFRRGLPVHFVRDLALTGYYGFQDYATAFWRHHLEFAAKVAAHIPEDLIESTIGLLRDYEMTQHFEVMTPSSSHNLTPQWIQKVLQGWRNDEKDSFEERTSAIRKVIELVDLANLQCRERALFLEFNGVPRFKCPKSRCQMFTRGFTDPQSRDTHVKEHERPFKCPNEGCYAHILGFPSQSDLKFHLDRFHPTSASSRPLFPPSATKKTDIFAACERGDLDAVKSFVQQGIDVDATKSQRSELTPLVLAARKGHALVCQYLIQQGAKFCSSSYITSQRPTNALDEAIKRQDYGLFRILLDRAGDHEKVAFLRRSSLPNIRHYVRIAISFEAVEILEHLLSWYTLSSDAARDTILAAPFLWAESEAVTRVLLSRMKPEDINQIKGVGGTPLHVAVRNRNVNIVRLLLEAGADAHMKNSQGLLPLNDACAISDEASESIINILLDYTDQLDGESFPTLCWWAVQNKHEKMMKRLLKIGKQAHIDFKDKDGQTPLLCALKNGDESMVKLLLDSGKVNVDSKDNHGQTPLSWASKNGHESIVKLLLNSGKVNIDSKDNHGQTPLSWDSKNGHESMVKLLLDSGKVNIDYKDNFGQTPLSWASKNGHESMVKLLLDSGKVDIDYKDNHGQTPLSWASKNGHESIVKLLLDSGKVDVDYKDNHGQTPLSWASKNGHEVIAKLLLKVGPRVDVNSKDKDGQSPLSWAARNAHDVVVKLLMENINVDVDSKDDNGLTPLFWAVRSGHDAVVKLLLTTDYIDVNPLDTLHQTPLSIAAAEGYKTVVKLLLETDKVDVDSKDYWHRTPLSRAAGIGHEGAVKLLLATGKVNIDSKDDVGRTPLSRAVESGHEGAATLLLATGKVDINSKDNCGWTPLSRAAGIGHEGAVKLLLSTGEVDVDSKDNYGCTPLSQAAFNGHETVIKLLLATGKVDVNSKDNRGWTPLLRAANRGYETVVKLLKLHA